MWEDNILSKCKPFVKYQGAFLSSIQGRREKSRDGKELKESGGDE